MNSKYSNIQIFSIPDAMLYSVEHPELPEQYVRIEDFERLRAVLINLTVAAKNAAEYLNAKGRRMPALNAAIADADCASETGR